MSDMDLNQELVFVREFDAPRSLVWKVWTDPQHVKQWWGPAQFTNPKCKVDARSGGKFVVDMRGPDGTIYPMDGTFKEVIPPEKLVFMSGVPDGKGGFIFEVETTVTFTERAGKTTQTLRAKVVKRTADATPYLSGMKEGWTQSLVRLSAFVDAEANTPNDRIIHSSRVLNFPRELVWKAWTQPEHLKEWWGPHGFRNTVLKHEFKPGGEWELIMHGPDGTDYLNKWVYNEIDEPTRILLTHEKGHWFQVCATFADLDGKRTKLTFRMLFDSAEECARIRPIASSGNEGNFDRLSAHLETMS